MKNDNTPAGYFGKDSGATIGNTNVRHLAHMSAMGRRGFHLAPNQPTAVSQSTANAAAQIANPAYKTNNYNDYGPFDTLPFARDQQEYAFFTQGVGANGKTKFDTNMVTGSQFPLGRNVVVKGIGFHLMFSGAAVTTRAAQVQALYTLLENSYIEFVIQGRQFEFQAPGTYWLPEIAFSNEVSVATTSTATGLAAAEAYQRVGDFIKHGGYKLNQNITLQNLVPWQMNWYVNLQSAAVIAALTTLTPDGVAAARMRWQFLGSLDQGA
jgi:hypothetical protein